jgi:hypothetical protein
MSDDDLPVESLSECPRQYGDETKNTRNPGRETRQHVDPFHHSGCPHTRIDDERPRSFVELTIS